MMSDMTDRYRPMAQNLVKRKEGSGLSRNKSYDAVLHDIRLLHRSVLRLKREEQFATDPDNTMSILRSYVNENGHSHNGAFYFPQGWLDRDMLRCLESQGVIEKAGTQTDVKLSGVRIPGRKGRPFYYKVDTKKLYQGDSYERRRT